MEGYVPGLQPAPGQKLVKLNTNENPFPPAPRVLEAIRSASSDALRLYPDPSASLLRERAASLYGFDPSQVVCGNGSDDILAIVMRTFVDEGDAIAFFQPSYSLYPVLASIARARTVPIPLPRVSGPGELERLPVPCPEAKVFFLTTPNSPYGYGFAMAWIARLLSVFPGIVVADEAYADFARETSLPLLASHPRLIVARSLSKAYSLAGMRVGLAFAHETLAAEMAKVKDSYNLSGLAQAAACEALPDREHLRETTARIVATRGQFAARLSRLGFSVLPSEANFLFTVPPAGRPAKALYEGLRARGFLVRWFPTAGLSDGLRISIGTGADMEALARAIEEESHGG